MDFSRVCRTCLGTNSLKPIFPQSVDHRRYSTFIFITTGLRVEPNDGMPQHMCISCVSYLNDSLKFRRQCKDSETRLLEHKQKTNNFHNDKCFQESPIKIEDFTNDDLKIELKCEIELASNIEYTSVTIKAENDSDLENDDTPLSYLTETDTKTEKESENQEAKSFDAELKPPSPKIEEEEEEEELHHKKKDVQRVPCPVCRKDLSRRSLRAHMAACHAKGLRCRHCKMECASEDARAAHARSCPRKKKRRAGHKAKELVRCEVCHKTMQRASLRAHVAVQHKGLGPVCEHCGRRFGNKLRLSEHLRAKHGHAKLQCAHCDFTSASRAALENHERRHRGEKPFVCEACGAKFHAAYLLAQHRLSHRTERHVKCGLCGATFKSGNSLHAHRLARHGARAHRCPLCARAYRCRHYAVKHLRAVHGYEGKVPPLQVDPAPSEPTRE